MSRTRTSVFMNAVPSAQAEQPCGIVETDVLPCVLGESDVVDELAGFGGVLERVIGREQHVREAERADRAGHRLGRAHAGRGDEDILLDVLGRWLGELDAIELGATVEAPEKIRQSLAEVA